MDRLLSDEEICRDFCIQRTIVLGNDRCRANHKKDNGDCQYLKSYKGLFTKTAAAVNAEWVEWFEDLTFGDFCRESRCLYWRDCLTGLNNAVCYKWQARKKEKGL